MTDVKEVTYFGKECLVHDLHWYRNQFTVSNSAQPPLALGDISTLYARLSRQSVAFIRQLLPQARIVLILRNPIERCWSHALMELARDTNKNLSTLAPETLLRRFERTRQTRFTDYLQIIQRWTEFYPSEQFHIDLYDRVVEDPAGLLRDLLDFLEVDPDWTPPNDQTHRRVWTTHDVTQGRGDDVAMPPIVRWYLAHQWIEPMRQLNDRLDGKVSHWIEQMRQIIDQGAPLSWRVRKMFNRHVAIWPERLAYGAFDCLRERRLRQAYSRDLDEVRHAKPSSIGAESQTRIIEPV